MDECLLNLHNLQELTLGSKFNQPLNIPEGIKKLTLNCNSRQIIDYLPSNIVELELGRNFDLELDNLSSSIKKIKIQNPGYDKKLNNLPTGIEHLEINTIYKSRPKIDFKYKNLNIVEFEKN